ncbi:threonine/serine exporter family protein [Ihubacter sp. rT4E-8]|uniref:threonine/serine exporter family protein n=1 Tax=Ihubacter sp. rT4E-8 TaxID=3242369 RepID=UPI003CFAF27E
MVEFILQGFAAFIGTAAFSVLFKVPGRHCAVCGLVGWAGWIIYTVCLPFMSLAIASFLAAAVIALLSRILAVVCKVPANVIMIPGIFPIIPGISIYNMIYDLFIGNTVQGLSSGFAVLKIIGAMVLGMVVVFSLPRSLFRKRRLAGKSGQ